MPKSGVKVFRGSINDMEDRINKWVAAKDVRIISTSMTYDHGASFGGVFVIVSYETGADSML
jgi:hypothetical protein